MIARPRSTMSSLFLGCIALISLLAAADARVDAPQAATTPDNGQVVGFRILDSETGAAIAGATLNGTEKTDQHGTAKTRVSAPFTVLIRAVGYAPHLAKLDDPDGTEQTIRLRRAMTIGGRVRDERGSPIAGAEVRIFEPGWVPLLVPPTRTISPTRDLATVATDAEGRWVCAEVPADLEGVHITVHHPEHASAFYSTAPGMLEAHEVPQGRVRPISWAKLRSTEAESFMEKGLPVLGSVLDPAARPLWGLSRCRPAPPTPSSWEEPDLLSSGELL